MPYKFKLGGQVEEPGAREIALALSKTNLIHLLQECTKDHSEFSHQDLCNWCRINFERIFSNGVPLETVGIDESTYEVLNDIDAQWDLFLVNTYSIKQLQTLDLPQVKLPTSWFMDWLKQLE